MTWFVLRRLSGFFFHTKIITINVRREKRDNFFLEIHLHTKPVKQEKILP